MNIIQTKDLQSNNCNVTAWFQNQLVVETSYTTELLMRAPRCWSLNGQIRNFSFLNTILIARNKFHSSLDYSDNFEMFEMFEIFI